MSRRRKPPPPNPAVIPFDGKVVCTDRRRHPEVRITGYVDQQELGDGTGAWGQTRRWDVIADCRPDGFTLRFRCKRCPRDVRLRQANARCRIAESKGGQWKAALELRWAT